MHELSAPKEGKMKTEIINLDHQGQLRTSPAAALKATVLFRDNIKHVTLGCFAESIGSGGAGFLYRGYPTIRQR